MTNIKFRFVFAWLLLTLIRNLWAEPIIIEPVPSPPAGFNLSDSRFDTPVYSGSNDPEQIELMQGGGTDEPFDFKKRRPPYLFYEDSGYVLLMSLSAMQELISGAINSLLADDVGMGEVMDENGGGRSRTGATSSSGSAGNRSPGVFRTVVHYLCSCFTGGAAGGDGDDPRRNRNRKSEPESKSLLLNFEDTENEDEDDKARSEITLAIEPTPKEARTIVVKLEVDEDPPASEQAPVSPDIAVQHQGYIEIGHNVFHAVQDADDTENLNPSKKQQQVYVYLSHRQEYIPVLVNVTDGDRLNCQICQSLQAQAAILDCDEQHSFCAQCISQLQRQNCPLCQNNFSSSNNNKPLRREIASLPVVCRWCEAETSLSEIASHLVSCEQQPEVCGHCQSRVSPSQLAAHLKACTRLMVGENVEQLSEERSKQLNLQLISALQQAVIPDPPFEGAQLFCFPDGTVLSPVEGSPDVYTRVGSGGPEFYFRADLSDAYDHWSWGEHTTVMEASFSDKDGTYRAVIQSEKRYCMYINFSFSYLLSSSEQKLKGDWLLQVIDLEGEVKTEETKRYYHIKEFSADDGWGVFSSDSMGAGKARFNYFESGGGFETRPKEKRMCFFRIKFEPR